MMRIGSSQEETWVSVLVTGWCYMLHGLALYLQRSPRQCSVPTGDDIPDNCSIMECACHEEKEPVEKPETWESQDALYQEWLNHSVNWFQVDGSSPQELPRRTPSPCFSVGANMI